MGNLETFWFPKGMVAGLCATVLFSSFVAEPASESGVACIPVTIVEQPRSVTLRPGCQAVFSTIVSGSEPYTFQWLKNGDAIAHATNASYTATPVSVADDGSFYAVIVGNGCSQAISSNAILIRTRSVPTSQARRLRVADRPSERGIFTACACHDSTAANEPDLFARARLGALVDFGLFLRLTRVGRRG